jgi:hypothetical protein
MSQRSLLTFFTKPGAAKRPPEEAAAEAPAKRARASDAEPACDDGAGPSQPQRSAASQQQASTPPPLPDARPDASRHAKAVKVLGTGLLRKAEGPWRPDVQP